MLKALSIFGYLGMLGGLLGLAAVRGLFSPHPLVIAVQLAAAGLMVWARITFGRRSFHLTANPTRGGLVTTGPYRFLRHPIYAAVCWFTTAGTIANWSWPAGLLGGLIVASALMRALCEEQFLTAQYPEYAQYAAKTKRLVPFVF